MLLVGVNFYLFILIFAFVLTNLKKYNFFFDKSNKNERIKKKTEMKK